MNESEQCTKRNNEIRKAELADGIHNEDLLAILIGRLRLSEAEADPYSCVALARIYCELALKTLREQRKLNGERLSP